MHMSFSDLVRHSPGYPVVAWPRGYNIATLRDGVNALIHSATQLAAGRESHFLNQRVAVVSPHQEDWLLSLMMVCFGAEVQFLCPTKVVWNYDVYPLLVRTLVDQLEHNHPHLNSRLIREVNAQNFESLDHRFKIEQRIPLGEADPLKGLCDFVFVADFFNVGENAAPDDMLEFVTDIRTLAKAGDTIEVFGQCTGAKEIAVLDGLVQSSGQLGLGMGFAAVADQLPGSFRMSFVNLAEPIFEYPRAEQDHGVLLAHCEARLKFAGQHVRGARVLEAGCGTGIGARLFRAEGAKHVTGLDYSDKALEIAQRITSDGAIEFRQWNLNETPLPLPSEAFDVVVCLEVLEHVENHDRLVDEFHRVLKPGGRLVLSVPNKRYEDEWVEFNNYRNIFHVRVPGREEFEKLMGKFDRVKFARQIDFVGSAVIDEEAAADPATRGEFQFQPGKVDYDTSEVIVGVGIKGPLAEAKETPVVKPHLRVFDNFLATQLDWRRSLGSLRNSYLNEQYHRWSDKNRAERLIDNLVQQNKTVGDSQVSDFDECLVHNWVATQSAAFVGAPLPAGPWMDRLSQLLRQSRRLGSIPMTLSGEWEMALTLDGDPTFRRVGDSKPAAGAVIFPKEEVYTSLRQIWQWRRRGVVEVWFLEEAGWKRVDMIVLLARRMYKFFSKATLLGRFTRLGLNNPQSINRVMTSTQKLFRRPGVPEVQFPLDCSDAEAQWKAFVQSSNAKRAQRPETGAPLKITQYTGALYAGGAERQLCNLALGLKDRGVDVDVLTTDSLVADRGHYRDLLHRPGIDVRQANARALTAEALQELPWHLLYLTPPDVVQPAIKLAAELYARKPDVLHCWLDQPNVIGGLAALIAGVPAIVLSTRNSNPTNFPRINFPFLQPWYKILALSRRVHFIANSRTGAASYAEWLGLPVDRFHVVFNGVCWDHFPKATDEARKKARASFGLGPSDRVVCGAFRLAAEKQPLLFLDVVRRVRQRVPNLRVLLAGTGDLEGDVRDYIHVQQMSSYVQLLGRRNDVGAVLLASDASLLTSTLEGCPNIALESQHLGVPIVATAGGGTTDAVLHGKTGYLAGVDDAEALAGHLTNVLLDDALRASFAAAAPKFVQERFGLDNMVENTLDVCEQALDGTNRSAVRAA